MVQAAKNDDMGGDSDWTALWSLCLQLDFHEVCYLRTVLLEYLQSRGQPDDFLPWNYYNVWIRFDEYHD